MRTQESRGRGVRALLVKGPEEGMVSWFQEGAKRRGKPNGLRGFLWWFWASHSTGITQGLGQCLQWTAAQWACGSQEKTKGGLPGRYLP